MLDRKCTKCGETKPLDDFPLDKRNKDGHGQPCRECKRAANALYRLTPGEKERKKARNRRVSQATRDKYKERAKGRYPNRHKTPKAIENYKRWHERNPGAKRAHQMLYEAIKKGEIDKASDRACTQCGKKAAEYHHHNGYNVGHEFDVIPVCRSCHRLIHKSNA